jgi:hypothetical protein
MLHVARVRASQQNLSVTSEDVNERSENRWRRYWLMELGCCVGCRVEGEW